MRENYLIESYHLSWSGHFSTGKNSWRTGHEPSGEKISTKLNPLFERYGMHYVIEASQTRVSIFTSSTAPKDLPASFDSPGIRNWTSSGRQRPITLAFGDPSPPSGRVRTLIEKFTSFPYHHLLSSRARPVHTSGSSRSRKLDGSSTSLDKE